MLCKERKKKLEIAVKFYPNGFKNVVSSFHSHTTEMSTYHALSGNWFHRIKETLVALIWAIAFWYLTLYMFFGDRIWLNIQFLFQNTEYLISIIGGVIIGFMVKFIITQIADYNELAQKIALGLYFFGVLLAIQQSIHPIGMTPLWPLQGSLSWVYILHKLTSGNLLSTIYIS